MSNLILCVRIGVKNQPATEYLHKGFGLPKTDVNLRQAINSYEKGIREEAITICKKLGTESGKIVLSDICVSNTSEGLPAGFAKKVNEILAEDQRPMNQDEFRSFCHRITRLAKGKCVTSCRRRFRI
jgi:hypothetical protein